MTIKTGRASGREVGLGLQKQGQDIRTETRTLGLERDGPQVQDKDYSIRTRSKYRTRSKTRGPRPGRGPEEGPEDQEQNQDLRTRNKTA
jgi:hypothetical protein